MGLASGRVSPCCLRKDRGSLGLAFPWPNSAKRDHSLFISEGLHMNISHLWIYRTPSLDPIFWAPSSPLTVSPLPLWAELSLSLSLAAPPWSWLGSGSVCSASWKETEPHSSPPPAMAPGCLASRIQATHPLPTSPLGPTTAAGVPQVRDHSPGPQWHFLSHTNPSHLQGPSANLWGGPHTL